MRELINDFGRNVVALAAGARVVNELRFPEHDPPAIADRFKRNEIHSRRYSLLGNERVGRKRHFEVNRVGVAGDDQVNEPLLVADILIGIGNPAVQVSQAPVLSTPACLLVEESRRRQGDVSLAATLLTVDKLVVNFGLESADSAEADFRDGLGGRRLQR